MLDFLILDSILTMPNVMSDKLFNLGAPGGFQISIRKVLYFRNQTLNILNQDVIASN